MDEIKRDCFAYKEVDGIPECNCLTGLYCEDCPFYQHKKDVRDNIFYRMSFANETEFRKALDKYCLRYGIGHLDEFEEEDIES